MFHIIPPPPFIDPKSIIYIAYLMHVARARGIYKGSINQPAASLAEPHLQRRKISKNQ